MFLIPPQVGADTKVQQFAERIGLRVELEADNRLYVSNMQRNGPAESAGVTFGDYITALDVEKLERPATEWVYLLGFLLLGLVLFYQVTQRRGTGGTVADREGSQPA